MIATAPAQDAAYADMAGDVALALESDEVRGLSEADAVRRLERFGPNLLRRAERPSYVRIAVRQLANPLTGLLLAAATVSAVIGEGFEAGVIAAIVVLNAVLGFFQESGAERALMALSRAVELSASVVRGGRERTIAAAELVPGDLIIVREGDRAPADARVVAAERFAVDESALTGESATVEKRTEQVPAGTTLAERFSMVYAGTGVTRGRARALVTATGGETELGNIARLASAAKPPPTPLQRRLAALSRAMIALGLAVMVVLAAGMLLRGASLHEASVETLVDVRRFPGSRRHPQFSQAALAAELQSAGIAYLHAPDLGGRRSDVRGEHRFGCLRVPAFRSYAAWMSSSEWQQAIADALGRENPCFMCAETLPWRCHRRLIADLLAAREVEVVHLLGPRASVEQRPFAEAEVRNGRLYLCGALVA